MSREWSRSDLNVRCCQREEQISDLMSIEDAVIRLVRVAEQAVVAGRSAVFSRARRSMDVVASSGVEVTDLERTSCNRWERLWDGRPRHPDSGLPGVDASRHRVTRGT